MASHPPDSGSAGGSVRFSLLHATFRSGLPALAVRDAWLTAALSPADVEHIFACDADDEVSMSVDEIARGVVGPPIDHVSAVRNWNAAAAQAKGDVLVVIADDLWPVQHWDRELAVVMRSLDPLRTPFVLHVCDSHEVRGGLIRHPVVSREFFRRFGLWWPDYHGYFVDQDFTLSAFRNGLVLDGRSIRFDHRHPFRGVEPSESHKRLADAVGPAQRQVFDDRWPLYKRSLLRRYFSPRKGQTQVSELCRRVRGAVSKVGYLKGLVPTGWKKKVRGVASRGGQH